MLYADETFDYCDHIGYWRQRLQPFLPNALFDAHVHMGPREAIEPLPQNSMPTALTYYQHLSVDKVFDIYRDLYQGKMIGGMFAFGFPICGVRYDVANDAIIKAAKERPHVKGFLLADPFDMAPAYEAVERAFAQGVRFYGVKPYFHLLGRRRTPNVYDIDIDEFVTESLLAFMNRYHLILMLHTSRVGMGDVRCQTFVQRTLDRYPNITIILAHMGRYLKKEQFFDFFETTIVHDPRVYLECSSASIADVYECVFRTDDLYRRLLFGSDLPYGCLTGMETFSESEGPGFVTRDRYPFQPANISTRHEKSKKMLTYNTYHTIDAVLRGLFSAVSDKEQRKRILQAVFYDNAMALVNKEPGLGCPI